MNAEKAATLKEHLKDWCDFDVAELALAQCLGLMSTDWKVYDAKWVFWSANPTGDMLKKILDMLVVQGVLERSEDEQYRFNTAFRPPSLDG